MPLTAADDVERLAVKQPASLKTLKVIVPVGPTPPLRWAVSLIDPPIATSVLAVVVSCGLAWLTTLDSPESPHLVAAGALLLSPL